MSCSIRWQTLPRVIRIRSLNGRRLSAALPEGRFTLPLSDPFSNSTSSGLPTRNHTISAVTAALAAFGDSARKAIDEAAAFGDQATSDVFTEISRDVDHQLWLVESHLSVTAAW